MSLKPNSHKEIPELTVEIATAVFPKGNCYLQMRDELGTMFTDVQFVHLFSHTGQPAIAPWRLALVTIMQFAENLTDRQAAEAVRARIDWKYALSLDIVDKGFNYSVLSEFRSRLIKGQVESSLLDGMLDVLRERGLVKAGGIQRTDSTHILASIRLLNRLELIGETLHHALNFLAEAVPDWVQDTAPPEWYKRYGLRFDNSRLPHDEKERDQLARAIGIDGLYLMEQLYNNDALHVLHQSPCIETLRQVWIQQFCIQDGQLHWRSRSKNGMAPAARTILSPYDVEARFGQNRGKQWKGYKLHLTESCDDETPHLITNVVTTTASVPDNHLVATIHDLLAGRRLLPNIHLVDTGYPDGENLVTSADAGIDLYGPVRPNNSWQARHPDGYDVSRFNFDWERKVATCPQNKRSIRFKRGRDISDREVIKFLFSEKDCRPCSAKSLCTNGVARQFTLLREDQHEALQAARRRQKTAEFKQRYSKRAAIEGTISQAVQALAVRRSRYRGLDKTYFHHVATAAAMNFIRVADWFAGETRSSAHTSRFARLAPA